METNVSNNRLPKYLSQTLLKKVSRSFYLTLKILPNEIHDVICLAYLIARTGDQIADAALNNKIARLAALDKLHQIILNQQPTMDFSELHKVTENLKFSNPYDQQLIAAMPDCLSFFYQLSVIDRQLSQKVLNIIFTGFKQQVEKLVDTEKIVSLESETEMQEYIYQFAGCVGEFWTDICYQHINNYSCLTLTQAQQFAVEYGKALQLVNTLRDIPADILQKRCYLPRDQLEKSGISIEKLSDLEALYPIVDYWRKKAEIYFQSAKSYVNAINYFSLRYALALPILLGEYTLEKLNHAGYLKKTNPVKAPRWRVRLMMLKSLYIALRHKF